MIRRIVILLCVMCATASAHVGSPDVFYEGDAGAYHVFVTVHMPDVIPGVATIEVRAPDVTSMDVVPLRLTGPGSELPPTPDRAERSTEDPQFFTANLWLMEHGSLQVRITANGAHGRGVLSVPIPASAQRTLGMDRTLGAVLLVLMLLLGLSIASIAGAAVREAALDPGAVAPAKQRRRARIATAFASVVVAGLIVLGNHWWTSEAAEYETMVSKPWHIPVTRAGCALSLPSPSTELMLDHAHEMHLFVVRTPGFDRLAHLHPVRQPDGSFLQQLPSLPAGHYALFADVVLPTGFPFTGTGAIDLPDLECAPLVGDDASWLGTSSTIAMDPPVLRANVPQRLTFHATGIEPYMGMAGHAAVMRTDLSVFAHLHPSGTVAMPALMLAQAPHDMFPPGLALPPVVSFPYAFPQPGEYMIFVQLKRGGAIETAAFPVTVRQ